MKHYKTDLANLSTGVCFWETWMWPFAITTLAGRREREYSIFLNLFLHPAPHFVPFFVLSGWSYLPYYLKLPVILLITVISGCGRHVFWQAWVTLAPIMWDVTEVKTVHFPSKSEEVLICWVKALLEGRGQSVIGPLQEYEIATTMMSIHTLSDTSRPNTLSIFLVSSWWDCQDQAQEH